MKRVQELTPSPKNPRIITDEKVRQLRKSMDEYGDLSGIVFNVKTGHLVAGHQRSKNFDSSAKVVYTRRFPKPTKKGTTAVGYIRFNGERFAYREVVWTEVKETGGRIAANKNAGDWDMPVLTETLQELASFDVDYDMDLTMFDVDELSPLLLAGEGEVGKDRKKKRDKSQSVLVHKCPECGHEFQ